MTEQKKPDFPFMIIRLWPHHHNCKADLQELVEALKRNRAACDEVWFCTEFGFPPLEGHRQSARFMAEAAKEIRALGIEPGLQVANTLGHSMNLLQDNDGVQWPLMMGPDGVTSRTSPCPRAPESLSYLDAMMCAYAAWQPSSVWIDDDLRMTGHDNIKFGCFCDCCVKEFSSSLGQSFDRPGLVAALNAPDEGQLRLAWTRFNSESLATVAGAVAQAVHAVAPECRMGLQQGGVGRNLYSGVPTTPILERMSALSGNPVRARLGTGYYMDHVPRWTIEASFYVARQAALIPECVDQVCTEVDSYPHIATGKSVSAVVLDATLGLAMGCNSLSFAVLCSGMEPMSYYESYIAKIASCRPFWLEYARANAGTYPGGLEVRLGMEHVARSLRPDEPPFAWGSQELYREYFLSCFGVPLCTSKKGACGILLPADAVAGLSDEELRKVLTEGAMLDGRAAMQVQERGMGQWLGVRITPLTLPAPYRERMSDHEMNGNYAGKWWDSGTNPSGIYQLEPLVQDAILLGNYEDRLGAVHGPATVLTSNAAGGRIAVFGYFGWEDAPSGAKRNQYLVAADWIARGLLPVIVQTPARTMVVPRVDREGRFVSALLVNSSFDPTPPLELRLRGVFGRTARWLVPEGHECELNLMDEGMDKLCTTPSLAPWSVACIVIG